MSAIKTVLITLLAGALSIGIAVLGEHWLGSGEEGPPAGRREHSPLTVLPDLRLADIHGRERSSREWTGKVVVLHYWATWCPACIAQLGTLMAVRARYSEAPLQIVGIAIDRPADVADFLAHHPLDYLVLLGEQEAMAFARRLGNGVQGLPFTVVFDRVGQRVFGQTGEIDPRRFEQDLARLLANETSGGPNIPRP